jgi:preprotein translocase subunit YajC
MFDLISIAHAEGAAGGSGGAAMGNIIFMVLLFGIFYFLLIRPQQKQQKAQKEMVANLQRGDTVITNGGLMGKLHRVEDEVVTIEVGEVETGNKTFRPVRLRVRRPSISAVTTKAGEPVEVDLQKKE